MEKKRTLYVFIAYGESIDINHVYAIDELSARQALNDWRVDQEILGRKRLQVLHCPQGCNVDGIDFWPGSLEADHAAAK